MNTKMKPGKKTGIFGKELYEKYKNHIIFYDHGDASKNDNVVACKGICGNKVKNVYRLTDIDIMIADSKRVLKILIEIEEGYCSPKKIIGDIFSATMCNQIAIRNESSNFNITKETILIIGGVVPPKGIRRDKIKRVINKRIKTFYRNDDGLDLNKVEFYFEENIKEVLKQSKHRLNNVLI